MAGHISYPRTDNTVYPSSLDLREALEILAQGEFAREAGAAAGAAGAAPQPGRQADHRPPAHLPHRAAPAGASWATASGGSTSWWCGASWPPWPTTPSWSPTGSTSPSSGEPFVARGNRVVTAGWLDVLPLQPPEGPRAAAAARGRPGATSSTSSWTPRRPSRRPATARGTLIELMEKHNLGTKATRHAIIQNLYDRGYVHGNPVEPTEMGIKMAEALQEYAPRIASPEMTAELEKDMDLISERDLTKEQVVTISRDLLREAYGSLEQNRSRWRPRSTRASPTTASWASAPSAARTSIRIIRSKATKKRFVGCEGYPDCDQTYPLPQRGDIIGTGRDLPAVRQPQGEDPGRPAPLDPLPRPALPHQGRVQGEAGGSGGARRPRRRRDGDGAAGRRSRAKKTGGQEDGQDRRQEAGDQDAAAKTTAAKKPAAKKTAAKKTATTPAARARRRPPTRHPRPPSRRRPRRRRAGLAGRPAMTTDLPPPPEDAILDDSVLAGMGSGLQGPLHHLRRSGRLRQIHADGAAGRRPCASAATWCW